MNIVIKKEMVIVDFIIVDAFIFVVVLVVLVVLVVDDLDLAISSGGRRSPPFIAGDPYRLSCRGVPMILGPKGIVVTDPTHWKWLQKFQNGLISRCEYLGFLDIPKLIIAVV